MNKLKEINGKFYQEAEVVMLATDKRSCLFINKRSNQLQYYFKGTAPNNAKHQHLYFLSNEEIKEGDWYCDISMKTSNYGIHQCDSKRLEAICNQFKDQAKKIIATTDTSLFIESPINIQNIPTQYIEEDYQLPQPSKAFIQAYIKAYNEGKPITKVLVEMESIGAYCNIEYLSDFKLKVNPSNEITIKKIKDSYTREELPSILQSYLDYCLFSGYITPIKFIEENL